MGNSSYRFFTMPSDDGRGPKKIGDPEDQSLVEVEKQVLIPTLHHHLIMVDKCKSESDAYNLCSNINSMSRFRCREHKKRLKECMNLWDKDENLKENCVAMYLSMRAEYRRTGVQARLPNDESDNDVEI